VAYPTLAQLKVFLGITLTTEDTVLQQFLDGAKDEFERDCNRVFVAPAAAARNFWARAPWVTMGRRRLTFFADLLAVTSVVNGDGAVIAAAQYELQPNRGAPYCSLTLYEESGYRFTQVGVTPIVVTATWGYASTCPAAVFLAIMQLASVNYHERNGAKPELAAVILKIKRVKDSYRRYSV
jgi:hypothetical protein